MTTTYKPLTPGEALDALIRGERVEFYNEGDWIRTNLGTDDTGKTWVYHSEYPSYRLVIGPESVEDALEGHRAISVREHRSSWLRVFAALKYEIKAELREEMKR